METTQQQDKQRHEASERDREDQLLKTLGEAKSH